MLPHINIGALLLTIWFRRFMRTLTIIQTPAVSTTPPTLYFVPPVILLGFFICYITRNNRIRWPDQVNALQSMREASVDRENENENKAISIQNRIKKVKTWVDSNFQQVANTEGVRSHPSHISIGSSQEEPQPSTSEGFPCFPSNERVTQSCPLEQQHGVKFGAKRRNRNTYCHPQGSGNAALRTRPSNNRPNLHPYIINPESRTANGDSASPAKSGKLQDTSSRPETSSNLNPQQNPLVRAHKTYGVPRRARFIRTTRSGKVYGFDPNQNQKK